MRMLAITLVLLRKRVFTKSPVRENRTPGSVRRLLGNWQSYRDQLSVDANDGNAQSPSVVARGRDVPKLRGPSDNSRRAANRRFIRASSPYKLKPGSRSRANRPSLYRR